jgi:hypothetical protein
MAYPACQGQSLFGAVNFIAIFANQTYLCQLCSRQHPRLRPYVEVTGHCLDHQLLKVHCQHSELGYYLPCHCWGVSREFSIHLRLGEGEL